MADETPQDPDDAQPITPEVVDGGNGTPPRRGASSRKRRMGPIPDDGPASDVEPGALPGTSGAGLPGRTFARGCTVLVGMAVLIVMNGVVLVASPDSVRCTSARDAITEALDDDEDFNDVDLPEGVVADEIDDLECDQAISLAAQIPDDEDEEPTGEWVSEGTIRTFGIAYATVGVIIGTVGFLLLRRRTRGLRIAALALTGGALLLLSPALVLAGLPIGLAMAIYVLYAIGFSKDAKALFPVDRTRPGLFRPRPPAAS